MRHRHYSAVRGLASLAYLGEREQCGSCEADEVPGKGLCQRCIDIANGDLVEESE